MIRTNEGSYKSYLYKINVIDIAIMIVIEIEIMISIIHY